MISPLRRVIASSIAKLAPLPLHRKAGGIADLDPDAARTGSIRAVDFLRHNPLGAKLAGVREDDSTVLNDVFVEDASLGIAQQPRQRGLAGEEWTITQVLAVVLDQVEGVKDRGVRGSRRLSSSNRDKPSGSSTTASPLIVKLLALIRSAPSAIPRSRAVQSFALRL